MKEQEVSREQTFARKGTNFQAFFAGARFQYGAGVDKYGHGSVKWGGAEFPKITV